MANGQAMIYSKLFEKLLETPALYVGHRSITKIKSYIDGYKHAKIEAGDQPIEDDLFFGFQPWIEEQLELSYNLHWSTLIQFGCFDEVEAFERTKRFWEEYKTAIQAEAKILVSACLLGQKVRYDGSDKNQRNLLFKQIVERNRVVTICPEVAGGLSVPRLPAEIQRGDGNQVLEKKTRVLDSTSKDVTAEFVSGAQQALALAQTNNVHVAILKARSPSCGNAQIYDGTFGKRLIEGSGVTAALLEQHGIKVFNEDEIAAAIAYAAEHANED